MYHRIAVERFDPWGLAVRPDVFAEQLKWLRQRRCVIPLVQFAALAREGRLPPDALAITFDDGYACNAEVAAPLLARSGLPATIFLPAALIERGREFWWDELERIVLQHRDPVLRLGNMTVPLGERDPQDRLWSPGRPPRTERQRAYQQIWAQLRTRTPAAIERALDEFLKLSSPDERPRSSHRPMTPEQAKRLERSGIHVGSHTLGHPSLPALERADKEREIVDSVEACVSVAGVRPRSFAYPYGDHDNEAEELVEQAGFECACTTEPSTVSGASRRFALPRVQVGNWTPRQLAGMLAAT
jgi:peptidoglycan/xylan/chitin deacetylase (PgdA/CDA1 family)